MTSIGIYLQAAFEIVVGVNFIFSPEKLQDGYMPQPGYETHAFENLGISFIFWGLLLLFNSRNKSVIALNVFWNIIWVALLGSQIIGKPWRPQSEISSADHFTPPTLAHAIFAVFSLIALARTPYKIKKP